jgi:hypothetical protein
VLVGFYYPLVNKVELEILDRGLAVELLGDLFASFLIHDLTFGNMYFG